MNSTINHKRDEQKDRAKSAIITFLVSFLVLLIIYFYKFTRFFPKKDEVVTTMLINFGDRRNGNGQEEPMNQEGSMSSSPKIITKETPKEVSEPKKTTKEKIITGNNKKKSVPKVENKITSKTNTKTSTKTNTKTSSSTSANIKTNANGDGKGTAAIGNLIRGRGAQSKSQGTNGTSGNAGDPLGGDGNGTSTIGVDRKLIGFIPGTMGRGGAQPNHSCTASGKITISYVVDKSGNVVSAKRATGLSDPCVVSTTTNWVKKYVKAEKANTSSTGTYSITF